MKDDYLWDGSGEPDADVEQLEKLLGSYRYQPRPLDVRFEQQLATRRPFFWVKYAAAAVILMALVGAWWLVPRTLAPDQLHAIAEVPELTPLPGEHIVDLPAPTPRPGVNENASPAPSKRSEVAVHVKKAVPPPTREDVPTVPL